MQEIVIVGETALGVRNQQPPHFDGSGADTRPDDGFAVCRHGFTPGRRTSLVGGRFGGEQLAVQQLIQRRIVGSQRQTQTHRVRQTRQRG